MKKRALLRLAPAPALVRFLLIMTVALAPAGTQGAGLRDFADGWLLGNADMEFILAPLETEVPENGGPGSVPRNRPGWGLWGGAGQGRLYSMIELPLLAAEGGVIHRGAPFTWKVSGSWERLGEELMQEDTGAIHLGLGSNPRLGVGVWSRRWQVGGQLIATHLDTALEGRVVFGIGPRLRGFVDLSLHQGPLPVWYGRGGRRTLAEIKFLYPGSGLACRLDQRGDGGLVLSLEVMVRLSSGLGLGLRADPETGSLGGSLAVRLGGAWLNTSHLVHPALGVTHRFRVGTGDPGAATR